MRYQIVRTDQEIDKLVGDATEGRLGNSRYPGETFESGIMAALEWLTDPNAEYPFEEEE